MNGKIVAGGPVRSQEKLGGGFGRKVVLIPEFNEAGFGGCYHRQGLCVFLTQISNLIRRRPRRTWRRDRLIAFDGIQNQRNGDTEFCRFGSTTGQLLFALLVLVEQFPKNFLIVFGHSQKCTLGRTEFQWKLWQGKPRASTLTIGFIGRRRSGSVGLRWRQNLLHGLPEFTEVGVFEFLAELVVGVFGRLGDRHAGIVGISSGLVYRLLVVSNSAKAFGSFRMLCR